jgi:hypothetical protein
MRRPARRARAALGAALVVAAAAGAAGVAEAQSTRRDSAAGARARPDTAGQASAAQRGARGELTFRREVYEYAPSGRRDPFVSLLASGELRPVLSDLRLVTVLHDPTGRNSVAILRDNQTKEQYRVRVGQQLGRMRVAAIQPRQVVFTIEEFGYSRQETLVLGDTTNARTP